MTSLSNINQPISYTMEIYPFADPLRTETILVVNTITAGFSIPSSTTKVSDFYYLEAFSFGNDIFDPRQRGAAKVVQTQYEKIDFFKYVAEGDLIFIKENGINIFSGYIESTQLDISLAGTSIIVNFVNFLQQLSMAKVFGLLFDTLQPAQGVTMGDFLNLITGNTLIGIGQDANKLFSFDLYMGQGESSSLVLTDSSKVFVTITSFMNILQAINKILYPYQRLIYQDSEGNIVIAPLSLFDDLQWFFDKDNIEEATIPYISLSIKKNAAAIPNYEFVTLFTLPTLQGVTTGNQSKDNSSFACQYTPPKPSFTRINQLYHSGNFTIADVIIEDIIVDPAKIDQTLNNISELLQGTATSTAANVTICSLNKTPNSQPPLKSKDGKVDVSAIIFNYAARAMAEHLVEETQVSITSMRIKQRDSKGNLLPLPINRLIDIAVDDGVLENSSLFCRGYNLNYSASGGTIVTLNCTKPLVGGAYWVNGGLVSV